MGWQTDAAFYIFAWKNASYPIIKLTNGAPGSSQCLKNIHPKFLQPCKSHFSVSQCGQDICIKLSGITQLMARTKYLFYPWSDVDYNISGVDIIVHIKGKIRTSHFL